MATDFRQFCHAFINFINSIMARCDHAQTVHGRRWINILAHCHSFTPDLGGGGGGGGGGHYCLTRTNVIC